MTKDMFEATPPHKLARTYSPATSKQAAHKVDTKKRLELVYADIVASGEMGTTGKEIVGRRSGVPYSSITARFKQLEEDGRIFYLGDVREGARVARDKEFDCNYRVCPKCTCVLLEFYNYECHRCNNL